MRLKAPVRTVQVTPNPGDLSELISVAFKPNGCLAFWAMSNVASGTYLQDAFDGLLKAYRAQVMLWLTIKAIRLQSVQKSSCVSFGQLVALLLFFPAFKLSNFGFKFAYAARERHMLKLGCIQLPLQLKQRVVQFNNLGSYRRIHLEREQTLRDIARCIHAADSTCNPIHHGHVPSGEIVTHEG